MTMIEAILIITLVLLVVFWPIRPVNPCRPWCPVFENPSLFGYGSLDDCRKKCFSYQRYRHAMTRSCFLPPGGAGQFFIPTVYNLCIARLRNLFVYAINKTRRSL